MACRSGLNDADKQGIVITVGVNADDFLRVPGGCALVPQRLP